MVTVTTESLERAERWVSKFVSVLNTTATTLENVNVKVVKVLDDFAENLENEIAKVRDAHDDAVDACMANHPAGSGVFDEVVDEDEEVTDVSREEKIKAVQDYLRDHNINGTDWVNKPDAISATTVNWAYDFVNNRAKPWETY